MKPFSPPSSYPVTWNGLKFSVPKSWEPIVKGNSHFIFESELRPVLEIRWEKPVKRSSTDEQFEAVFAELKRKKTESPIHVKPPAFLADLPEHCQVGCYGRDNVRQPEGACIVCRECGTIIMAHFFPHLSDHFNGLCTFFQRIDCHTHQEQDQPWTILDISFRPPDSFELDRFSFGYGISRIEFKNKTSRLTLCRLAPASKHLEGSSLGELFSQFTQTGQESHTEINENTFIHSSRPGLVSRLLSRLGKRKPFTWSRFTHNKEADRILGVSLKSSKPLAQDHVDTIGNSYGILQQ